MFMPERKLATSFLIPDRIYGEIELTNPLVVELLQTESVQRLAYIQQMGVYEKALPHINTTRLEHSLGVYHLLSEFGASEEEQIAGLLHDVSHPAFSHVIDHLFESSVAQDFQDKAHEQFLMRSEIPGILQKYGIDPETAAKYKDFPLLEQPLPYVCADRLDYFLRDGFVCSVLTQEDVGMILGTLSIIDNHWVFNEPTIAQYYFEKNITMARDWWAPDWGVLQFQFMAQALRRGLEVGFIIQDDLFTTDQAVWEKLEASKFPEIIENLDRVRNIFNIKYEIVTEPTNFSLQSKYRGSDPLVEWKGRLIPISRFYRKIRRIAAKNKREIESIKYVKLLE